MSGVPHTAVIALMALLLIAAGILSGSEAPSHCADYTTGRRCTTFGYGLMVLSVASVVTATVVLGLLAFRAVRARRGA